ncbi:uncharacterized protein [Argopecten irradians]|uniref:uncharacterized protein n=1 Tax=Argopecten irradians TaxID=31199 RepID=UPI0037230D49
MENSKNMKRKREEKLNNSDKKVKKQCVEKKETAAKLKTLKENNHKDNNTESYTGVKKRDSLPNVREVSNGQAKSRRKQERKQKHVNFLKKKRSVNSVKSDKTEMADCEGQTDRKKSSVQSNTDKKSDTYFPKGSHTYFPKRSQDFSSNWEQLKQKVLPPSQPKKHHSKKKEENKETENPPEIWFDDVDESLLDIPVKRPVTKKKTQDTNPLVKEGISKGLTKAMALDCEFVGIGANSKQNMLARVSLVNHFGHCVYDTFVKPQEEVTDYRTWVSGVREEDLLTGVEFSEACKTLAEMIKGRVLVGHALKNDLKVLYLSHPKKLIRDTSKYKPFRQMFDGKTPSLKKLTAKVLDIDVQEGEHSSVQDAQATMRLYTMYKQKWEKELALKNPKRQKKLKNLKQSGEVIG